jgi:pimeloyl-ACP methyl ester carboxylesterase
VLELLEVGRPEFLTPCSGAGSPTVVRISGKGNGAEDWREVLGPSDKVGRVTFVESQASAERLAADLGTRLVTDTDSGHNFYANSPALVIDAVRDVVGADRIGVTRSAQ